MQIKYIGKKEHGHTTFTRLTGITWYPGDVHPVKDEHARVLLRHPDAFEVVPDTAGKTAPPEASTVTLAPGAQVAAKVTPAAKKAATTAPRKNAKKAKE